MIEILFGPIASGKSTYASERAKEGAIIVNDDAIVMLAHGGHYDQFVELLKPMYKSVANHLVACAMMCGLEVVVDMPCRKRSTRDRYRLLAESFDVSCRLTLFRGGHFAGRTDGERRYLDDPRGLSLEAWREVGKRHQRLHDPVDREEEDLFTYVHDVPWIEQHAPGSSSVPRRQNGGGSIELDASN